MSQTDLWPLLAAQKPDIVFAWWIIKKKKLKAEERVHSTVQTVASHITRAE